MACCLTALNYYQNQCWLIIKYVLWHPTGSNFTRNAHDELMMSLGITLLKLPHLPRGPWLKSLILCAYIFITNSTIITLDNGLSPVQCHAINWSNAGLISIWLSATYFSETNQNTTIFIEENVYGHVICQVLAILSQRQYVYRADSRLAPSQ